MLMKLVRLLRHTLGSEMTLTQDLSENDDFSRFFQEKIEEIGAPKTGLPKEDGDWVRGCARPPLSI